MRYGFASRLGRPALEYLRPCRRNNLARGAHPLQSGYRMVAWLGRGRRGRDNC